MKAIMYKKYGNADRTMYVDIDKPVVDKDLILVKIHAASINCLDIHVLEGKPWPLRFVTGIFKPKSRILWSDISGVIEAVGENIQDFEIGDEVFGQVLIKQSGGFAEYAVVTKNQLTKKPANVSHAEAASISIAGLTALQACRQAGVTEGSKVLIYGASGGVGTFVMQIAKSLKANVTAVCSTRNLEVAKSCFVDKVIDYKKEKWDKETIQYDIIIGVNGYNSLKRYRDSMTENGIYLMIGGETKQMIEMYLLKPFMRKKKNQKYLGFLTKVARSDLDKLAVLLGNKEIRPHIDKEFSLEDSKAALKHFMSGKTIGKTIIKIQ